MPLQTAAVLGDAPFSLVAAVLAYALAPIGTQLLLCVLHELAHVLAAMLVGFRVVEIDLGRGPAWFARWWGGACVTLRPWPLHGYVRSLYRGRRWLRTRLAAVALAGPLWNVLAAVAMQVVTSAVLDDGEYFTARGALLWATTLSCWVLALGAFVPALVGGRRGFFSSDVQFAWLAARANDAQLDDGLAANLTQAAQHRFERAFHRGDLAVAEAELSARVAANGPDEASWSDAALFALARGDATVAFAAHERAEAAARAAASVDQPDAAAPSLAARAARHEHAQQLAVARTFFLVQRGDPAALAEAQALAAAWPTGRYRGVPTATRTAMLRTRGELLLAQGQPAAAVPLLRAAVRGHEPYWLRAIGMALLAQALLGAGGASAVAEAVRWAARARQLDPHGPLLPRHRRLFEAALAERRASAAAIR